LFIQAAGDGMDINHYYSFDWVNPMTPNDKAVYAAAGQLRKSWKDW
jgi:hypothetical protein